MTINNNTGQSMFAMAHELGALLTIRNRLGLTPLTLAAKLARRDMFFHILKIEREIYWQLGHSFHHGNAKQFN